MSAISLKSISGITSITTPAGVDNVFTVHTNDTTERFRIDQTGNQNIVGIVTVTKDLDVDGHTNLDNVSIAGVTTIAENKKVVFGNNGELEIFRSGTESAIVESQGNNLSLAGNRVNLLRADRNTVMIQAIANGPVELYHANALRLTTSSVGVSIPQDLDVDGHTNLDNVSISGVSTFSGVSNFNSNVSVSGNLNVAQNIVHTGDTDTKIEFLNNNVCFDTAGNERLRIDSNGRLLVNRTAQHSSSSERLSVNGMTSIQYNSTSTASLYLFNEDTTSDGSIQPFIYLHDGSGLRFGLGVQRSTGLTILNGQFGLSFRTGSSGVGGTEKLRITSSGEVKIADGGFLSVNTSPGSTYGISEALRIDDGAGVGDRALQIFEYHHNGARYHRIQFNTNTTTNGSAYTYTQGAYGGSSSIEFDNSGHLSFYTNAQVTGGSTDSITPTERLRITSGGQVLIGTTSVNNANKIHARLANGSIANTSNQSVILAENSGNTWITIGSGASNYGGILFADSGSSDIGQVRYNHTENSLEFLTNGGNSSNIRLSIRSDGIVSWTSGSTPLSGTSNSYTVNIYRDSGSGYGYLDCVTSGSNHTGWYLRAYHNGTYNKVIAHNTSDATWFETGGQERLRIKSDGSVNILGPKLKLPTGTSNPGSSVTGDSYYNTSDGTFKIYDGSVWGSVVVAAKGTQQNPAANSTELAATGALAQYYFKPNTGDTAFQQYACGGLSILGTIPSGGPSWVTSHSSLIIIEKGQLGTTTTMKMSQANYGKFIKESITRNSGTTPYVYWAVFDGGTLWGIWRIRWTGATYSTWISNHNYTEGSNTAPSGSPSSDVWKTGSGTTGNALATGTYTISNNTNLNRAVLPEQDYNSGGFYGIHYKRLNTGEHYPWRDSSGNYTSNGYFQPSTSYSMGSDSRYVHYVYLADN